MDYYQKNKLHRQKQKKKLPGYEIAFGCNDIDEDADNENTLGYP